MHKGEHSACDKLATDDRSPVYLTERPPKVTTPATVDMQFANLSPEIGTKFQQEVPLFLEVPEFPFYTVYDSPRIASELDLFSRFDKTPACDGRTDRQTDS